MKINVGCGEFPAPGWMNLDMTHPSADLHCDIRDGLPSECVDVERIYFGHVLEHLAYEEIVPMMRKMPAGATVAIVGPECDRAEAMGITGEELRVIVEGGGRWVGDVHQWRSTVALTIGLCWQAGWRVMPVDLPVLTAEGWPLTSEIGWQFGLIGVVQ